MDCGPSFSTYAKSHITRILSSFDVSGTRDGAHECLIEKIRLGYPLRPDELMLMLEYAGWKG